MDIQEEEVVSERCRVMTILTPHIVKRLDQVAKRKTVSRSVLIRQACESFLQEEIKKEAA